MNQNLNPEERELIKLANFFSKNARQLMTENLISEEHQQLIASCEKIVNSLNTHADYRASVLEQREVLGSMIKDNASCPHCESNGYLKIIGVDTEHEGWKCNKYKCRRCNITFVWNRPNNPWDMLKFIEKLKEQLQMKILMIKAQGEEASEGLSDNMLEELDANIETLRGTIETVDKQYEEMQAMDAEMQEVVKQFKKHLQIEKIRIQE